MRDFLFTAVVTALITLAVFCCFQAQFWPAVAYFLAAGWLTTSVLMHRALKREQNAVKYLKRSVFLMQQSGEIAGVTGRIAQAFKDMADAAKAIGEKPVKKKAETPEV